VGEIRAKDIREGLRRLQEINLVDRYLQTWCKHQSQPRKLDPQPVRGRLRHKGRSPFAGATKEDTIPAQAIDEATSFIEELEATREVECIEFELGDHVVYPHHGAGKVLSKEDMEVLGTTREYLTIKILHNDMTVKVPTENAALAGLRRVIDEETVKKVLDVLTAEVSEMPKNWNRRFKHNRDKIKTGDIYELAEVVRNLALRESEKGLSTGEKQMFTRAKKILASELMYALDKDEDEAESYLDELLATSASSQLAAAAK
jgi:CarD family transcriptional regulator